MVIVGNFDEGAPEEDRQAVLHRLEAMIEEGSDEDVSDEINRSIFLLMSPIYPRCNSLWLA